MAEDIQTVSIARETHERYLRYAMSVITSRALPDVRDGLKPVQRRILYTMFNDLHLHVTGGTVKCARVCGDVMGKYHPHGDTAIYDALVRLAQTWVMSMPLVYVQGNFGSVDGDPPAHARYTEAKLTAISDHLLKELRQNTVEMRPNYDSNLEEPVVVPAEFPNLLLNGASGIAVGMATNIPPHNLGELLRACIHLVDNPEATTAELMNRVKGPDFPLGGKIITDRLTLRKIYEEGEGTIKIQGEWKTEGEGGKKPQIIITSIPYNVDKGKLENDVGAIIEAKKLPQLTGLSNETNEKDGLRIALDMKPGTDPNVAMAYLYKHTNLQDTFSYNLTCLVPGPDGKPKPERLGLKGILRSFLDFRFITVTKRFEFELAQLRKRIHILEGFRIIFDALDKAIKLIRESSGKQDASERLIAAFELDEEQTAAILDAQLYKIAQLEIKKILDELKEKTKEAKRIDEILKSEPKRWEKIKEEFNELLEKFNTRRRTRMASDEDVLEFNEEQYIVKENTNVVLTRDGWIKRVGKLHSVEGTRVRQGDEVIAVIPGSTLDHVVFFSDDGTAYTMRINEVPASSGHGEPITKFFKIPDQVKIIAAETTDTRFVPDEIKGEGDDLPGPYVLVATSAGYVLRVPFSAFRIASTKTGRRFVRLEEADKVVMVKVLRGEEESMFLASVDGHLIHFALSQVNVLSGAGKGVMGIKLADDDKCLGGALVSSRFDALVVETTGGITKEFRRGAHPTVNRGGKGTEVVKRTNLVRVVPPPIELTNWDEVEAGVKPAPKPRDPERNGDQSNGESSGSLFPEE
jgi:DNA gyrase subunit A